MTNTIMLDLSGAARYRREARIATHLHDPKAALAAPRSYGRSGGRASPSSGSGPLSTASFTYL